MFIKNLNYAIISFFLALALFSTGCSQLSETAASESNQIQNASQNVSSEAENPEIAVSWEVMPNDLRSDGESAMLNMAINNKSDAAINGIAVKVKLSGDVSFDVADAFTTFEQKDGYMIFYDSQRFDPGYDMALSISIHPKKIGEFNIPFYFYSMSGNKSIKVNGGDSIHASFSVTKVVDKIY